MSFSGLVPHDDQNATRKDRTDEYQSLPFVATKGGVTDIQEHKFNQLSNSRRRTGHIPAKVR